MIIGCTCYWWSAAPGELWIADGQCQRDLRSTNIANTFHWNIFTAPWSWRDRGIHLILHQHYPPHHQHQALQPMHQSVTQYHPTPQDYPCPCSQNQQTSGISLSEDQGSEALWAQFSRKCSRSVRAVNQRRPLPHLTSLPQHNLSRKLPSLNISLVMSFLQETVSSLHHQFLQVSTASSRTSWPSTTWDCWRKKRERRCWRDTEENQLNSDFLCEARSICQMCSQLKSSLSMLN